MWYWILTRRKKKSAEYIASFTSGVKLVNSELTKTISFFYYQLCYSISVCGLLIWSVATFTVSDNNPVSIKTIWAYYLPRASVLLFLQGALGLLGSLIERYWGNQINVFIYQIYQVTCVRLSPTSIKKFY